MRTASSGSTPSIATALRTQRDMSSAVPASVHESGRAYSFFDLKGAVEQLLGAFQHKALRFENALKLIFP